MTDPLDTMREIQRSIEARLRRLELLQKRTIPPGQEDAYRRRQASRDRFEEVRDRDRRQRP